LKIPVIKKITEKYSISELEEAENDILNELNIKIEIDGDDEGEKLTHVLASIWILQEMEKQNIDFTVALRLYSARVRTSIN
jgi:hypothetical protein